MTGPVWWSGASCRDQSVPTRVFFPEDAGDGLARQICAGCLVREDCLEFALSKPWLEGIWGGLDEAQRDELHDATRSKAATADPGVHQTLQGALAALRSHRGHWAKVAEFANPTTATSTLSGLRTGRRQLPNGRYELVARRDGGRSSLFARYLGPARSGILVSPDDARPES